MELDVFRCFGSVLERVGTCEIRSISGRSFEVLHQPANIDDDGPLLPVEAHAFQVIDLNDESGLRAGVLAQDQANPSVLPGWRATSRGCDAGSAALAHA